MHSFWPNKHVVTKQQCNSIEGVSSCITDVFLIETILEHEQIWAGLECVCGELIVVCYWLISCE